MKDSINREDTEGIETTRPTQRFEQEDIVNHVDSQEDLNDVPEVDSNPVKSLYLQVMQKKQAE